MKTLRKLLLMIFTIAIITSLSSCDLFKNQGTQDPSTFDSYTEDLFKTIIGDDELTIHWLFKNPASYGLPEHSSVSLPNPTSNSALGKIIINLYFGQIKNYDYSQLSFDQKMTYNLIVNLLDNINSKSSNMDYMSSDYLGSYLGYQAQLPLLLAEYSFNDMTDINNYFAYMDLVPETFKTYVDFEIEKASKGYGMPDYVIEKVINQCSEFINDVDNHFLVKTFSERLENLDFELTESKDNLIAKNYQKIIGPLKEGYQYIKDNLINIKGKATNNLGLYYYEEGQEYYNILFKNETGYDITIPEAISYIEEKLTSTYQEIIKIIGEHPNISTELQNINLMEITPSEQIEKYKTLIEGHFPKIDIYPNIILKYIDKSMENHFSPAAYMTSPIDDYSNEYIYLNALEINGDNNYLYHTLAHEGIPGHLYQNIYFKNQDVNVLRKVLKNSGYVEGWATYVEMYSYNLCPGIDQYILDYLRLNDEFTGALTCRIDMGIHYEGWNVNQVKDYLSLYLNNYTLDNSQKLLEQLVEIPTNSQKYYFTYFKLKDMYNKTKSTLGDSFVETDFHKLILDCGPVPLQYIEIVLDDYLKEKSLVS